MEYLVSKPTGINRPISLVIAEELEPVDGITDSWLEGYDEHDNSVWLSYGHGITRNSTEEEIRAEFTKWDRNVSHILTIEWEE